MKNHAAVHKSSGVTPSAVTQRSHAAPRGTSLSLLQRSSRNSEAEAGDGVVARVNRRYRAEVAAARIDRINYPGRVGHNETRRYAFLKRVLPRCKTRPDDGQGYVSPVASLPGRVSTSQPRPDAPLCHGVLHLGCGAYARRFLPKPPITRLNAPSSLIFMRTIRIPRRGLSDGRHYTAYRIQRHGRTRNLRDSTSDFAHLGTDTPTTPGRSISYAPAMGGAPLVPFDVYFFPSSARSSVG